MEIRLNAGEFKLNAKLEKEFTPNTFAAF